MIDRFSVHNHSDYSNLRLLDAISTIPKLAQYAAEIGLRGIAITEHEFVGNGVQIKKQEEKIRKKYPYFKIGIGNEIYLTDTRENGIKYWHCILIAKDKIGYKQLRILSSQAWLNSYVDRGMERVPTLKSELEKVVRKDPGHLIITTACLGSEVNSSVLAMEKARKVKNTAEAEKEKEKIIQWILWAKELFKDDLYLEVAPGDSIDQVVVNKKIVELSKVFKLKIVIGDDSHRVKKEDEALHEAFLNSKDGEREVREFYHYAYLHTEQQCREDLSRSIVDLYEDMCKNSMEIYDKIEDYNIFQSQKIPKVPIPDIPKQKINSKFEIINSLFDSDDKSERYWIKLCIDALKEKFNCKTIEEIEEKYPKDLEELELEANIKRIVGANLQTNMFNYPITLKHYIDMIWAEGSILGVGRGSAPTGLNHYLLNITQLDPLKYSQKFRRYMNEGQRELGDVDIDLSPTKKPSILRKIAKQRGESFIPEIQGIYREKLGCTMIGTFSTASTKKAIQIACLGYRSPDFPDGIDSDIYQYLSSIVVSERGFLWSIKDMVYGNEDKGRKPNQFFINEVNKYPGLLDIILGIEGLIVTRSSHASGVLFTDEDPYELTAFMKTPSGDIVTQFDLHDLESVGGTKYDFLVTQACEREAECLKLLQKDNLIDPNLSLKEAYDKYLHPDVLDFEDKDIWKSIQDSKVLNLFQFDSREGKKGINAIRPSSLLELSNVNGLIRLVAPEGSTERPIEKYQRFKANPQLWYDEMKSYGLTDDNIKTMEKYYKSSYGISISQENFLFSLTDPGMCNWDFTKANSARRVVSKKKMDQLPILKKEIIEAANTPELGKYYWDQVVMPISSYALRFTWRLTHLTCSSQG